MSFAFVFDMDGVIVDSNPYHKIALREFCGKHGYTLTETELREKIYGRANKDWIPNLFGRIDPSLAKRYADEKESLFREIYAPHIQAVPGLIEFLDELDRSHIARAIATSAPRANVDFTLDRTGISHYFEVILDESLVNKGKPDPEIYLKTAKALNLPPNQCVVIEDSLSGVEAATAAGSRVIAITTTHSKAEFPPVDLVIDNFVGLSPKGVISRLF